LAHCDAVGEGWHPPHLLGLPRRTKVEQIRERDLMMPQEIRQMSETKMVLLVEGQCPIFGDKLRFFETQPFKSAEAFSQARMPDVPPIEYLSIQPVPALTDYYAQAGQPAEDAGAPTTGMLTWLIPKRERHHQLTALRRCQLSLRPRKRSR
ncbi:type IV secretory system conjugative DNA transfer family protein, partial [Mesorhizobium sp.]|uniref:type IV secretory system conjugative DNA transfer family protein n=1 Tax=Mesorhizobium sp. TaxID=1871066 RepID=UPI001210AAFC